MAVFSKESLFIQSLSVFRGLAGVAGGSNEGGEGELSIGVESCGTAMM